jgi:hypothetical protein
MIKQRDISWRNVAETISKLDNKLIPAALLSFSDDEIKIGCNVKGSKKIEIVRLHTPAFLIKATMEKIK